MGDEDLVSTPSSNVADVQGGGMTIKECQEIIQESFSKDPKVKILMESLEKLGCKMGSDFIRAVNCESKSYGGYYDMKSRRIVICCNGKKSKEEVVTTLIHELIHAHDHCDTDYMEFNVASLYACTEIRANRLSGDCNLKQELLSSHLVAMDKDDPEKRKKDFDNYEFDCVVRKSMASLLLHYSQDEAESGLILALRKKCYYLTEPFNDKPPNDELTPLHNTTQHSQGQS